MRERWRIFLLRYRELLLYSLFGVGTFLIDTGGFFLLDHLFQLGEKPWRLHACSVFATLLAVTFAYVTNRRFVFHSQARGRRELGREMLEFYAARGTTMAIAEVLMQITVVDLDLSARGMKLLINILVIAMNYLFSKLWIFKNRQDGTKTQKGETD